MQVNKCLPSDIIWLFIGIISIYMYIKLKEIEDNNMVFNIFDKKDDLFFYTKTLRYTTNLK